jgi:hypothetical protein
MVQKINKKKGLPRRSTTSQPRREILIENKLSDLFFFSQNLDPSSSLTASQTSHFLASEVILLKDPPCCPDLASFFVLQIKVEGFKSFFFRSNSEDWSEPTDECLEKQREFKNKMKFDSFVEALKIRL